MECHFPTVTCQLCAHYTTGLTKSSLYSTKSHLFGNKRSNVRVLTIESSVPVFIFMFNNYNKVKS